LYFSSAQESTDTLVAWLQLLEHAAEARAEYLKVFVIRAQAPGEHALSKTDLETLGQQLGLKFLSLTWVPSFEDTPSECHLYHLDSNSKNTFLVYRLRTTTWSGSNLSPSHPACVLNALDAVRPRFGIAPQPRH
jgi:hypothetical protein